MAKKKNGVGTALQKIGLITAGAIAGKMLDKVTGMVTTNTMIQDGAKVAVALVPQFIGTKNEMLKDVALGVGIQGAYGLVSGYLPSIAGVHGISGSNEMPVIGNSYSYDEIDYMEQAKGVAGAIEEIDTIGGTHSEMFEDSYSN